MDSATGTDAPSNGVSASSPFATIDYAVGQTVASRGDIIYVLPGHAESVTAAGGLDLDQAGISIIGQGNGRQRPTITLSTAVTADIDVDAADITLANCVIDATGIDSVNVVFDVNAAGFTLMDCDIIMADAAGQADDGIVTGATTTSNRLSVIRCRFLNNTAGPDTAIDIVGTPDDVTILGCLFQGAWAEAPLHNATGNVATNLVIEHNVIEQTHATSLAIDFDSACTGYLFHNNYYTPNQAVTPVDIGILAAWENYFVDGNTGAVSGALFPAAT